MADPTLTVLALLGLAGLAAGFVDAVVGGGGLIQLPAILLGLPGAAPVQVLATNKLASICGTSVSSATYYRRVRPDPKTFGPLMLLAFTGSVAGALVASQIPKSAFDRRTRLTSEQSFALSSIFMPTCSMYAQSKTRSAKGIASALP